MKIKLQSLLVTALSLGLVTTFAQPGGPGGGMGGPSFGGSMSKLFGDNKQFSAVLEIQPGEKAKKETALSGKLTFDEGKSRFEMEAPEMGSIVVISRPDKKASYMIYPTMKMYMELPLKDAASTEAMSKYKVESTELGKETLLDHPCVKNKIVVTDDQGKKNESIVWNATDLKSFPVKIETTEDGTKMTMIFKDVKLTKPDATLFEVPKDMQRMGGAGGFMPPTR